MGFWVTDIEGNRDGGMGVFFAWNARSLAYLWMREKVEEIVVR